MFKRKLWLLVLWLIILAWLCSPGNATTQYFFTYHYTNSPSHNFSGYVYAPDGWLTVGSTISYQPNPMGGAALGGYYYITGVTTGASSSYDKQEYVTSSTDYNGTIYSIWNNPNHEGAAYSLNHPLYIADRSINDEAHVYTSNGTLYGYAYAISIISNPGSLSVVYEYGFDLYGNFDYY